MDSHGGKLYLTDPVTPKGTNRTISIDQANKLLNEKTDPKYAKCIATGHEWVAGQCLPGRLVAISGPTVCHQTSEGQTCESGSVPGSGWIPVKYINHTAPDPGCTRVTGHPYYESCVDVTNTNATKDNETNTNATGNQSQTTTDAYSRGYSDAVADAHYENGHGYDSSCPNGHSEAYCQNYQSGYTTGWRSVTNHIP
jgi:hypothetical protein